jgi:hypothetical protein
MMPEKKEEKNKEECMLKEKGDTSEE